MSTQIKTDDSVPKWQKNKQQASLGGFKLLIKNRLFQLEQMPEQKEKK